MLGQKFRKRGKKGRGSERKGGRVEKRELRRERGREREGGINALCYKCIT